MSETGCDMSEEELLALLKGISAKAPSPKSATKKNAASLDEAECYMAPAAETVLAQENPPAVAEITEEALKNDDEMEPLATNFLHKQWKSRQQAYLDATALFSACSSAQGTTDPTVKELAPLLAGAADDSNASANDSALEMIAAWAAVAPSALVASVAEPVTCAVAGRGFTARASSQAKAHECLLKLMESDEAIASVVSALLAGFTHKKPKVPPECVKCLVKAYDSFGAVPLPNKLVLAKLKPIMEHTKKEVRAAALDLAAELCRWVSRSPIESALADLKSATKKEVDARLDSLTVDEKSLVPSLGTRAQRKAAQEMSVAAAAAEGSSGAGAAAGEGGGASPPLVLPSGAISALDLVESVNLPAVLSAKGCEFANLVAPKTKWNEKKAGLELCLAAIGDIPKLLPDDPFAYAHLVRHHLLPLVEHSHQQVSTSALKVLAKMGQGLGDKFSVCCHGPEVFTVLASRLKDKKLVAPVGECLDSLVAHGALSLDKSFASADGHSHDTVLPALVDARKAPQPHARVAVLNWLERSLKRHLTLTSAGSSSPGTATTTAATTAAIEVTVGAALKKQLQQLSTAALEAAEPVVRDAAEGLLVAVCACADRDCGSKEHKSFVKALDAQLKGKAGAKTKAAVDKALKVLSGEVAVATLLNNFDFSKAPSTSSSSSSSSSGGAAAAAADSSSSGVKDASVNKAGSSKSAVSKGSSSSSSSEASSSSDHDGDSLHCASTTFSAEDSLSAMGSALYGAGEVGGAQEGAADEWVKAVMPGLESDKWQDKVFAFGLVGTRCGHPECASPVPGVWGTASEAVVVVAETKTKKWSENNSVIIKGAFEMVTACAEACASSHHKNGGTKPSSFHRGAAVLALNAAVSKFGDRKLKDASGHLLTALARACGSSLVLSKACAAAASLKAPPAQQACLEWATACVAEFGAASTPLKPMCGLGASFAGHRDAKLRSSALDLLSALYKEVGPRMRQLCLPSSLPAAAAKAVEEALDKAGFDPKVAAAATAAAMAKVETSEGSSSSGGGGGGGSGGGAEGKVHRMDLGSLLDLEEVLERMGNVGDKDAWKQRKAALEEVGAAVAKSGGLLEANKALVETLRSVKKRVNDTQTNLKPLVLNLLAELVRSVDPSAVPKCIRAVAPELLAGCQDTKKSARDKVIDVLESCVTTQSSSEGGAGGVVPGAMDTLFPFLCAALHKAVGRLELLAWLTKHCGGESFAVTGSGKALDTSQLLPPLFAALSDRDKATRTQAAACLNALCLAGLVAKTSLDRAFQDLPPTTKRTLQPAVDTAMTKIAEHQQTAAVAGTTTDKSEAKEKEEKAVTGTASLFTNEAKGKEAETAVKNKGPSVAAGHKSISEAATATSTAATATAVKEVQQSNSSVCGLKRNNKKVKREAEFKGNGNKGWCVPPEEPKREGEAEALRNQWKEHLTSEAEAALFPTGANQRGTMEDASKGLALLAEVLESDGGGQVLVEHLDLVFKWLTWRLCERESVPVLQRLLDFTSRLLIHLSSVSMVLSDPEQAILFPYVCEKSGNGKQRFRDQFKGVMAQCAKLCNPATSPHSLPQARFAQFLLACTASTKRATTKAVCLGEVARLLRDGGCLAPFTKDKGGFKGQASLLLEAAKHVESSDSEVRSAALHVLVEAHGIARYEAGVVMACLTQPHSPLSDKVLVIVSERLKSDKKDATKRGSPRLKAMSAAEVEEAAVASAMTAAGGGGANNNSAAASQFGSALALNDGGCDGDGLSSSSSLPSTLSMSDRLKALQTANKSSAMPLSLQLDCHGGAGEDSGLTLSLATPMAFGGRPMPPPSTVRQGGGRTLMFEKEEEDVWTFHAPPLTPFAPAEHANTTGSFASAASVAVPPVASFLGSAADPAVATDPESSSSSSSSALSPQPVFPSRRKSGGLGAAGGDTRRRSSGKFSVYTDGGNNSDSLPGCGGGGDEHMQLLDFNEDAENAAVCVGKFAKLKSALRDFLALPEDTEKSQDKRSAYAAGKEALRGILRLFKDPQALQENDAMFKAHGNELFALVGQCLRKSFSIGGAKNRHLDTSSFTYSVTLLNSLAKHPSVHQALTAGVVQDVVSEGVARLLQGRADADTGASPTTYSEPLLREEYLNALSNNLRATITHAALTVSLTAIVNLLASDMDIDIIAEAEGEDKEEKDAAKTKRCIVLATLMQDILGKEKLGVYLQSSKDDGGSYSTLDLVAFCKPLEALVDSLSEASRSALSSAPAAAETKMVKVCRELLVDLVNFRGGGGVDRSPSSFALLLAMDVGEVQRGAPVRAVVVSVARSVAAAASVNGNANQECDERECQLESLMLNFSTAVGRGGKEAAAAVVALAKFLSREKQKEGEPSEAEVKEVSAWLKARSAPVALVTSFEAALHSKKKKQTATPSLAPAATTKAANAGEALSPRSSLAARIAAVTNKQQQQQQQQQQPEAPVVRAPSPPPPPLAAARVEGLESSDDMLARIRQRLALSTAPTSSSTAAATAAAPAASSTAFSSSVQQARSPLSEATNRQSLGVNVEKPQGIQDRFALLKARASQEQQPKQPEVAAVLSPPKVVSCPPTKTETESCSASSSGASGGGALSVADRLAALRAKIGK